MKSKNLSEVVLTVTVVLCSGLLLGTMTYALGRLHWWKSGRTLQIEARDATGVKLRSIVRYAGVPAGTVSDIRYPTPQEKQHALDPNNLVRVVVALDSGTPPLGTDVTARLESESLLGEQFIALVPGSPSAGQLPDNAVIQGLAPTGFDELANSAQATLGTVNEVLGKLNSDYPSLMPRLIALLSQANLAATNATLALAHLNDLFVKVNADYRIIIPKLEDLLDTGKTAVVSVNQTVQDVGALANHADQMVLTNQANLAQLIANLRVTAQNLKVVTTYLKAATATLGSKPSRLIWGFGETKLPSEQEILQSSQPVPIPPLSSAPEKQRDKP